MWKLRAAPVAVLVLAMVLAACGAPRASDAAPAVVPTVPAEPESFTVVATGDVLIHQGGRLVRGASLPGGGFDFSEVFAGVAPILQAADLAICHLETPVAPPGGPYRGYPDFAAQPQIVDALAGAGYDECSTSSNHSLDGGFAALARTLDTLDAAGIGHAGTARDAEEAARPRIIDVTVESPQGGMAVVQVGHVAGTYGLNGGALRADRAWAVTVVQPPDVTPMLAAAALARAAGAQVVVASLHCCAEYDHTPTAAQVQAVHALLASPDIDLVIGHHAHVVQPFERVAGKWAAYGLGNHLAEQAATRYATYDSVIARFTFTRGTDGRFAVSRAEAIPVQIARVPGAIRLVPADPATRARVVSALDLRGAVAAGLEIADS